MDTAVVGGVGLAYQVRGEGPPVLLLCGAGQEASTYELFHVPSLVSEGFQAITFDYRGTAPSEAPPGPYSMADMISDTIGLIEHLDRAPMHLFGTSSGGWVAEEVARTRPDLVRSATAVCGIGRSSAWEKAALPAMADMARAKVAPPVVMSLPYLLAPATLQDDNSFAALFGMFSATPLQPPSLDQLAAWGEWAESDDKRLSEIATPFLVIAFEHDIMLPPALARAAVDELQNAELAVFPGAAHLGIEVMSETIATAAEFFKRHS